MGRWMIRSIVWCSIFLFGATISSTSSFVLIVRWKTPQRRRRNGPIMFVKSSAVLDELVASLANPLIEPLLGPGFCNDLYQVRDNEGHHYVAKVFSDMAKERRPMIDFPVDLLASQHQVGPNIIACTPQGLLMEYVDGLPLEESALHSASAGRLLDDVASGLKVLHGLPLLPEGPNMLWFALQVMLQDCTCSQLLDAHDYQQSLILPLNLPECCGHGDFKPSNVMVCQDHGTAETGTDKVTFIDFELSGRHYRGFDVAKLFRTDSKSRCSIENLEYFCQVYADGDAAAIQMEANICTPLTWLEAAIFFDYAHRKENKLDWLALRDSRIRSYQNSLPGQEALVAAFQKQ